jgi:penicillin-binding protein 1A
VTIRSNYWGQGGHNALRIVGDFFRQGQKNGVLDATARFPDVPIEPAEFDRIEAIPLSASGEMPLGPPSGSGTQNNNAARPIESVRHLPPNPAEQRLQDLANGR